MTNSIERIGNGQKEENVKNDKQLQNKNLVGKKL